MAKTHKTRTLREQMTLTVAVITLAAVALISLLANVFINAEFTRRAQQREGDRAGELSAMLETGYNAKTGLWDLSFIHGAGMAAMYEGYIIRLADLNGQTVWDAENHDMEACNRVMMDIVSRMEQKRPGLDGKFVSRDFELTRDGERIGVVTVLYYGPYFLSESDFNFLDSLNIILLSVGLAALICSLLAGDFLARRVARPVIKTAQIATQIAGGNYKIRFVSGAKTRELDRLIAAVNHMASSLEAQKALRERLTNDVAHELRTPLAAVSSCLEAMLEGVWEPSGERLQSCYEEIGRMTALVADLERLAQAEEGGLAPQKAPLDLMGLLRQVAGNFESEAKKKDIAVSVDGEAAVVDADRDRLSQVFTNLLSNAINYTPEGGHVKIAVKDTPEGGVVTVADDGIGIPKEALELVFERFYRTDESRSRKTGGAGIGLTIVKSIVEAHGGTVRAESDAGSTFTVILPQSGAAAPCSN